MRMRSAGQEVDVEIVVDNRSSPAVYSRWPVRQAALPKPRPRPRPVPAYGGTTGPRRFYTSFPGILFLEQ